MINKSDYFEPRARQAGSFKIAAPVLAGTRSIVGIDRQ
jgi:hypothetical protein